MGCKLISYIYIFVLLYSTECSTLNDEEKELFQKFCVVLARELIPYLNKCVQTLFSLKSAKINKSASSDICLNVDQLTDPLLPLLPNNVIEPTVDADYLQNIRSATDSKAESNVVSTDESDSNDKLPGTEERTENESENVKSATQEEQYEMNDNSLSEQ